MCKVIFFNIFKCHDFSPYSVGTNKLQIFFYHTPLCKDTAGVKIHIFPSIYIYVIFQSNRQNLSKAVLCNQFLPPLTLWVRITLRRGVLDTTLCDKVCQFLATGRWFSPCTPVSSTNKTDRHDITEILLKVALNTRTLTQNLS